jgi:trimeric autotransporter adhesin
MRRLAITTGFILIISFFIAGCGGGSSSTKPVAKVILSPSSLSLNTGDVGQVSASPEDAAGNAVISTVTFTSSNNALVSVSPSGAVCAGTWDASFIVCTPASLTGAAAATITAAASGITSSPITVSIHPKVVSTKVDVVPGCLTTGFQAQLTAHAFSTAGEITTFPSEFTWTSLDPTVVTVDANGLASAKNPGAGGVFASISGVTSTPVTFNTCMPTRIFLHTPGTSPVTSISLGANQTQQLEVDMFDQNDSFVSSAPIPIFSNNPASTPISGLNVTGTSVGSGGLVAACIPPLCGNGVITPVYSNLFTATVPGASPDTTVYVTTSFLPLTPPATMIPIDAVTHAAGTAITLPAVPNSLVFSGSGTRAYLGTTAGLSILDPSANSVSVVATQAVGKVLAVSQDGNKAIVSNAANDPGFGTPIEPNAANQKFWVFDFPSKGLLTFSLPGAVAAEFDPDGFRAYIAANNGNFYVFSPLQAVQTKTLGGSPTDVAVLASEAFHYFANSGSLDAVATCNNSNQGSVLATAHQLVQGVLSQDVIVAVNSTGLDIETVDRPTNHPTPPFDTAGVCPESAANSNAPTYTNQAIDFGLGAFTARQLLVSTDGTTAAVLPKGINKVLVAGPSRPAAAVTLAPAGATEPLSGGMTLDGLSLWVGVAGSNTVDFINLSNNTDTAQVSTSFTKFDGTPSPPNIVAVRPK